MPKSRKRTNNNTLVIEQQTELSEQLHIAQVEPNASTIPVKTWQRSSTNGSDLGVLHAAWG